MKDDFEVFKMNKGIPMDGEALLIFKLKILEVYLCNTDHMYNTFGLNTWRDLTSVLTLYFVSACTAVTVAVELNIAVCVECGFMSTSFPVCSTFITIPHINIP